MHQDPINELKRLKQIRLTLLGICERQMNEVTKLKSKLRTKVDVSELYNPLLDIWKELK